MRAKRKTPTEIDDYIARFPIGVRRVLQKIRATIRNAAPDAEEAIKYGMPTFVLDGNLVHFAGFKKHVGLFPPVQGDARFMKAAAVFRGPKGNFRFPLEAPIPYPLIGEIVKLRVKKIQDRGKSNRKGR